MRMQNSRINLFIANLARIYFHVALNVIQIYNKVLVQKLQDDNLVAC